MIARHAGSVACDQVGISPLTDRREIRCHENETGYTYHLHYGDLVVRVVFPKNDELARDKYELEVTLYTQQAQPLHQRQAASNEHLSPWRRLVHKCRHINKKRKESH